MKRSLKLQLGSNPDPCYIQINVITNRVIKKFRCNEYINFPIKIKSPDA